MKLRMLQTMSTRLKSRFQTAGLKVRRKKSVAGTKKIITIPTAKSVIEDEENSSAKSAYFSGEKSPSAAKTSKACLISRHLTNICESQTKRKPFYKSFFFHLFLLLFFHTGRSHRLKYVALTNQEEGNRHCRNNKRNGRCRTGSCRTSG